PAKADPASPGTPATAAAIRAAAGSLGAVSQERIRDELKRMLTGNAPRHAVTLLDSLGLLPGILPELLPQKGCPQPDNFHPEGDVWTHTLLCLDFLPKEPSFELGLAALLHDVGKPSTFTVEDRIRFTGHENVGARMADRVCLRLRLSNEERERVVDLVRRHMALKDIRLMRPGRAKNLVADPAFPELLALTYADTMASHQDLTEYDFAKGLLAKWSEEELKPPTLLTGHDLIGMGLSPGPAFKEILETIRLEQLDGTLSTKEEALARARKLSEGATPA
ncbi:MAG: HD domain-containing protein, partial [Planctomycetota bacterium]